MSRLSLGFSTCPNDTYIFDALVHQRIKHDFEFEIHLKDVETLNQMARDQLLDITKISIHGWFHVLDQYRLMTSGGALGKGCGPLLISRKKGTISSGRIALPGELTTASLLFQMAFPGNFQFFHMPFDRIIPSILSEDVDAGVIIHESRFTYEQKNLFCLQDLGQWWEDKTGCLIPLGGIIISNNISREIQLQIQKLIKESICYVDQNPDPARAFIRENAQEMDDSTINSHIGLYVNPFSKDLGKEGRKAVEELYLQSCKYNLLPDSCLGKKDQLFVN